MTYDKPEIHVWKFTPRLMQGSGEEETEDDKVDVTFGTGIKTAWDREEEEIEL